MKLRISLPNKDDKLIDANRDKIEDRVERMGGTVVLVTDKEWDEWYKDKK